MEPIPPPESAERRFGPVRVRLWPDRHGQPAEPRVRAWLSDVLNIPDARLRLDRDERGRPHLADAAALGPIEVREADVNWSHSGECLIAACGLGVRVGIDVEWRRPRAKVLALARRFFAPEELAALERLADDSTALEWQFTRLWCAKEAVLKAHGHGLAFGLHRLHFAVDERYVGDPAEVAAPPLLACDGALGAPADWHLRAWAPRPGYWATLAWRPR